MVARSRSAILFPSMVWGRRGSSEEETSSRFQTQTHEKRALTLTLFLLLLLLLRALFNRLTLLPLVAMSASLEQVLADGKRSIAAMDQRSQHLEQEIELLQHELNQLRDEAVDQEKTADAVSLALVHQQNRANSLNAGIRDSETRMQSVRQSLATLMQKMDQIRDACGKKADSMIQRLQEKADAVRETSDKLYQMQSEDQHPAESDGQDATEGSKLGNGIQ